MRRFLSILLVLGMLLSVPVCGVTAADGELPENGKRRLLIHSRAENSELELTVKTGDEMNSYILDGNAQDLTIPGTERRFTMTISGTEVLSGYFNAVWE